MRYEYTIKRLHPLSVADGDPCGGEDSIKQAVTNLNEWACDDWELVSVVPANAEFLAFLKRPVKEPLATS